MTTDLKGLFTTVGTGLVSQSLHNAFDDQIAQVEKGIDHGVFDNEAADEVLLNGLVNFVAEAITSTDPEVSLEEEFLPALRDAVAKIHAERGNDYSADEDWGDLNDYTEAA